MASVTFGVTKFFITHFLRYGLRSPQSYLVVWTGLPGVYDAWTRRTASAQQMNLYRSVRLGAPYAL
jgi:hypothetical protein